MTRFADFDLEQLYHAEERRREKQKHEDALRKRKKPPKAPADAVEPAPASPAPASIAPYQGIAFEQPAYRKPDAAGKELLTYDASLARLQKAGFQRHPRPHEAFGLLIDGLEGKLTAELGAVSSDMLSSWGEWLSMAFARKGKQLTCYTDPVGLVWNKKSNTYKKQDFSHAGEQQFAVSGKASETWIDLHQFDEQLVRLLYGRLFSALPQEMREGTKRAQIYLPPDGSIWPVGRGYFGRYYVNGGSSSNWASRGVRPAQNFSGDGG